MTDRFCPSCGTEVDDDARFCPTCGRTLEIDVAEPVEAEPEPETVGRQKELGLPAEESVAEPAGEAPAAETATIPAAPAWPPQEPEVAADRAEQVVEPSPPPPAAPPPPPPPSAPEPSAAGAPAAGAGGEPDLPLTIPTTLSGWLIGAGSFLAALSLLPRLGNLLDLILFLALLAVSASVFLADRVPRIDRQRMITLVVLMIALGVGLERAGFAWRGTQTIFLVAMLFAAGGALLLEFDRDRPVTPPAALR